jgi:hypothetical protein
VICAGWREVTARTWTSIAYFAISNLAMAPLFVLGPFVAEVSLAGRRHGMIGTCAGIGSLLGDAAALRLRPRRPLMPGTRPRDVGARACAPRASFLDRCVVAAAAMLGFGALSFSNALWLTTPSGAFPASRSRVSAPMTGLRSRAFQPAGYALAGPAAAAIGIPATLAGAALHAVSSVDRAVAGRACRAGCPRHGSRPR